MTPTLLNNRYEVIRSLGRGSAGEVFLVADRSRGGEQVALKVLETVSADEDHSDHLRHEFSLLTRLNHPNLVEVYDFGFLDNGGRPFFTEEYIDGPDLYEAARSLPPQAMADVCAQLLRGLHFLHSRGFVHRDLKPGNILVSLAGDEPRAKILDLSLADEQQDRNLEGVKGSVHYMAPEVLRGAAVDYRADLYSLGITLYHVLEERLPFDGASTRAVIKGHLEARLPPLTQPPLQFFSRVLSKMTAKNPAQRYGSAEEALEGLSKAFGSTFSLETEATRASYVQTPGLMGRSEALYMLATSLEEPQDKVCSPVVFFLEGGRGTGKTRLLREFRHVVQMSHVQFIQGYRPRDLDTPYWTFQGALEEIFTLQGVESDIPETLRPTLARLFPGISGEGAGEGPGLDPGSRLRFHAEISRFLLAVAGRSPLCLCFDDFEGADRGSFELVGSLIRSLGEAVRKAENLPASCWVTPLSIVLSYDPQAMDPERYSWIRRNFDDALCRRIELSNLSQEDTRDLIRGVLGEMDGPPAFEEWLWELTRGNPGLLVQSLASLIEAEAIVQHQGTWTVKPGYAEKISLSPDGADLVRRRFLNLPEPARFGLRLLALSAGPLSGPSFSEVCAKAGVDDFEALEILLMEQLVRRRLHGGEISYAISDNATAEVAQTLSAGPESTVVHRWLAESLEEDGPHPSTDVVASLAYHFREARDPVKGFEYTLSAARRFAQMGAFRTALREYTWGLALLDGDGAPRDGDRVALLLERGGVHRVLAHFEAALEDMEEALRLAEEEKSQARMVTALTMLAELNLEWGKFFMTEVLGSRAYDLAKASGDRRNLLGAEKTLGMLALRRGEFRGAEERLRRAERQALDLNLPEDRGEILHGISQAVQKLGRLPEALALLREALDLFKGLDAAAGISRTLASIGNIHFLLGDYEEAVSSYRKALRINRESGDVSGMISINYSIGVILSQIGLYPAARKYFEASLSLARTFDLTGEVALSTAGLASLEMVEGRFSSALRHFGLSLEQYQALGARNGAHWASNGIGSVFLAMNQVERAGEVLERLLAEVETSGEIRVHTDVLLNLARVELRRGRVDEALDRTEQAEARARDGGLRDFEPGFALLRGEAALLRGDLTWAGEAFENARTQAAEMRIESTEAEANVFLSQTALRQGDADRAKAHARRALTTAEKENNSVIVSRAALQAARAEKVLENPDRAAYYYRRSLDCVLTTLSDLDEEYRPAYLQEQQVVFDEARWLIRTQDSSSHPF